MIRYSWFEVNDPNDYLQLLNHIEGDVGRFLGGQAPAAVRVARDMRNRYQNAPVIAMLQRSLNPRVRKVLVEYPYTDKDYRSTYYAFYAKRAKPYELACLRLHFFGESVTYDPNTLNLSVPSGITGHYLGFMVLRPTSSNTVVRAVIDPDAILKRETYWLTVTRHKVHLLGQKLHVTGYPFAQQAADVAVCAQTACWGLLRHYSERWNIYREMTLYEVSHLGLDGAASGLRSSRGLSEREMERILKAAGTYPLWVRKPDEFKDDDHKRAVLDAFNRELFGWLESGFPLIAMLDGVKHAISFVGLAGSPLQPAPERGLLTYWGQIDGVVAMDDGADPYTVVPLNADGVPKWPEGLNVDEHVSSFFVPLPEKLTYPSESIDRLATEFVTSPPPGFRKLLTRGCAVRYFVTTASALRRYARQSASALPPELFELYMRTELPQFVWVVELAGPDQAVRNHVEARLIVDATAAPHETFPVFFMHSADRAVLLNREGSGKLKKISFAAPAAALDKMPGDLKISSDSFP